MARSRRNTLAQPCPHPGCPELKPCPRGHGRPKNASWSTDRDRKQQRAFRARVLAGVDRCQRCGRDDLPLQAHHTQGDNGIAICAPCHRALDAHAR